MIRSITFVLSPNGVHSLKSICFSNSVLDSIKRELGPAYGPTNAITFNKVAWIKALREKYPMTLVDAKYVIESLMVACYAGEDPSAEPPTPWDVLTTGSWGDE